MDKDRYFTHVNLRVDMMTDWHDFEYIPLYHSKHCCSLSCVVTQISRFIISFIEMSNISKNSGTNVDIELNSIAVTGENGGRGECWKFNISNQFPILPPNIDNGEVVLDVDSPHKGYSIQTVMENGKMNGESRILNKEKIKVASLVFVDGIANGPCKLYDEEGSIVFEGYLKNGYREGK